jgi:hypothetical protein
MGLDVQPGQAAKAGTFGQRRRWQHMRTNGSPAEVRGNPAIDGERQ